jgi:hypothetical protein
MNKHQEIMKLNDDKFRRLTGVKKATFNKMLNILNEALGNRQSKAGRKTKLGVEGLLLMALEYLREYRTYFHIGKSYGVSESSAYKGIKWVEDTLVKHPELSLPGRKALLKSDNEIEVILVDVTESPIERPKKSKNTIIQEKRKDIH